MMSSVKLLCRPPPAERVDVVRKRFSEGMLRNLVRHLISHDIKAIHGRQLDLFDHELLAEMIVDRWAPVAKPWKDLRREDILDEDDEEAIAAHSVERNTYNGVDTRYQVQGEDGKWRHAPQVLKPKKVLKRREVDAVKRQTQLAGSSKEGEKGVLRQ